MKKPSFTKEQIKKDSRYFCREYSLGEYPKEAFFYRKVKDISIPFLVQFSGNIVNTEKYCAEDNGNYYMYAYDPNGNLMHVAEFRSGRLIRICIKSYMGEWNWYISGGNL
jgi:hypothetical protein